MNTAAFENETLLDNPIWSSLTTGHAHLAVGAGVGHNLARRYPSDIGPLSAFLEPSSAAFADLAAIIPADDIAVMFLQEQPDIPAGWQLVRDGVLIQMVCPEVPGKPEIDEAIIPMELEDFAEMEALAALTEPGPFRSNTASLGGFVGIRIAGRLAAIAGQRLFPTGFGEVSAVCTHPDFRGRGLAQALVAAVARNIHASGRTPFLGSFEANTGAIRVYAQVGFVLRRSFYLAVLKPPLPSNPNARGD